LAAFLLLRLERLPSGGTVTRHTRLALVAAVCAATLWPADLLAQTARSRTRSSGRNVVVVSPRYYRPYFSYPGFYYPGFYYPGFYGGHYSPFLLGFYGQYRYPYPPYGPWAYDNTGSARLEVAPRNAQVYVDGYFVGMVDSFDGYLQRLNVEAGEHELQFYLEGYRPFTQKVLFVRGRTVKITHTMQPLAPGEDAGSPPKPDESRRAQPYRPAEGPRTGPPPRTGDRAAFGSLLLQVRPADATVLVDGEVWTPPTGEEQFAIELAEGPHRIEVRKEGFQNYSTIVRVRRGETVRLNVSLTIGGVSRAGL
jgi:PEGA domain